VQADPRGEPLRGDEQMPLTPVAPLLRFEIRELGNLGSLQACLFSKLLASSLPRGRIKPNFVVRNRSSRAKNKAGGLSRGEPNARSRSLLSPSPYHSRTFPPTVSTVTKCLISRIRLS
jgi:hypothetical protein